jgi:hypothetical protein
MNKLPKSKLAAIIISSLAFTGAVQTARADQNNIDAAMKQAVRDYKAGGESAMTDRAKFCYDAVDYRRGNEGAAKSVEYCMSYDFAATHILSNRKQWNPNAGYFNGADVITRAVLYTEKARIVVLPEQFDPFWKPRNEYIKKTIPGML